MKPIAVFYHCLFVHGNPATFMPGAFDIVKEQMGIAAASGLIDSCSQLTVGINGGKESDEFANLVLPAKARRVLHGLNSKAENLTLVELEKWIPGHEDWNVLYFHAKGCTHPPGDSYGDNVSAPWRKTMDRYLVQNWRNCVADLESGYESVGCHFMRGMCDGTQNIWAGNFWWAQASYLRILPSIYRRERIKVSGIAAAESRYEAEVWIGNGPRLPTTKEYLPRGGEGCP